MGSLLLMSQRKFVGILIAFTAAICLHNFIYVLTGIYDTIFFSVAMFFIPAYTLIGCSYTMLANKKEECRRHSKIKCRTCSARRR